MGILQLHQLTCAQPCSSLDCLYSMQVVASCSVHHTEITLVSDWNSGLSFWSQMPSVGQQLQQPEAHTLTYDPSKTYVAVIASDGDNMQVLPRTNQAICPISAEALSADIL